MHRLLTAIVTSTCLSCALGAATYTVTNFNDSGPGSLRQAIEDANLAGGADEIDFAPALIHQMPATISLQSPLPDITETLTINGPARHLLTIERNAAAPDFRVFNIASGTFTIRGVTLQGGRAVPTAGNDAFGGAINTEAPLIVEGVLVRDCQANAGSVTSGTGGEARGGGIYGGGASNITLSQVVFENCIARGGDSTGGAGGQASGGGVYGRADGIGSVTDVWVIACHAVGGGGFGATGGQSVGGGAWLRDVEITGLSIEDCTATGGSGSGGANGGIGRGGALALVAQSGAVQRRVTLEDCDAVGGSTDNGAFQGGAGYGGGLSLIGVNAPTFEDLIIDGCRCLGGNNSALATQSGSANGGAVHRTVDAALTISRAHIRACSTLTSRTTNTAAAIYMDGPALTASGMTVIFCDGGIYRGGTNFTLTMDQCTLHGNVGTAGGILVGGSSTINLTNVTITNNQTEMSDGGGVRTASTSTINMNHCIVANNSTGGITTSPELSVAGTWTGNYNFIRVGAGQYTHGVNSNQVGAVGTPLNHNLANPGNNGGFAPTRMPNAGSPVINTGAFLAVGSPLQDQRSAPRHIGGGSPARRDIGAVEYNATFPTLVVGGGGAIALDSANPVSSYTLSGSGLSGPVRVTAPRGFGVSASAGGPFQSAISFAPAASMINTTVYVRYLEMDAAPAGQIRHESSELPSATVSVSALYVAPPQFELRTEPAGSVVDHGGTIALGSVTTGQAVSSNLSVFNLGEQDLLLNGTPVVEFTTSTNCAASLTIAPGTTILPTQSTPMQIEVTPTADGPFSVSVAIAGNDLAQPFTMTISGTASTPAPGLELRDSTGVTVYTHAGTQTLSGGSAGADLSVQYRIYNTGTVDLDLTGTPVVGISGMVNCTVTVGVSPGATIAPGNFSPFTIAVTPAAGGPFSFVLSIDSSDPNKPTHTLNASGTAVAAPSKKKKGGGGDDDGGCIANGGGSWVALLALIGAFGFAIRRRRV